MNHDPLELVVTLGLFAACVGLAWLLARAVGGTWGFRTPESVAEEPVRGFEDGSVVTPCQAAVLRLLRERGETYDHEILAGLRRGGHIDLHSPEFFEVMTELARVGLVSGRRVTEAYPNGVELTRWVYRLNPRPDA